MASLEARWRLGLGRRFQRRCRESAVKHTTGARSSHVENVACPWTAEKHRVQRSVEFGVQDLRSPGCVFRGGEYRSLDDAREQLPSQPKHVAAALVGSSVETLFREAKGIIESLGHGIHVLPLTAQDREPAWWADRGACLTLTTNSIAVGHLGVLNRRGARVAGIKHGYAVVFELDIDRTHGFSIKGQPLSEATRAPVRRCRCQLDLFGLGRVDGDRSGPWRPLVR